MRCTGHGNECELIPTVRIESRYSVERPVGHKFSSIYTVRELSPSEVGSHWRFYRKIGFFWKKKRPLVGRFSKFRSERIHHLTDPRIVCKFPEIWLAYRKSVKSCIIYLTQKTKNRLALASVQIAPKICHGQWQTMYSECPKFYPNRFTSSGVIAEHVNTIQMRHKVFPILGETIASRRVIN